MIAAGLESLETKKRAGLATCQFRFLDLRHRFFLDTRKLHRHDASFNFMRSRRGRKMHPIHQRRFSFLTTLRQFSIKTIAAAALALGAISLSTQAASVSVNFVGGQSGSVSPDTTKGGANVTGIAGAVPAGNWNNEGPSQQTTAVGIMDSTGANAASLAYTAPNNWAAVGAAPGGGTNADLMNGYLDNLQNGGSITVTGLGSGFTSAGYSVLVYQNADSAGSFGYTVTDNAGHSKTAYGQQLAGGNYPLAGGTNGFVGSTSTNPAGPGSAANYVSLDGFTGSNFTITGAAGITGDGRVRPNGFQVVSAPEPGTISLLVVGGATLLGRRRKA